LRVKLVAAVMTLVVAALLVISVASTWALRSYLFGQVDSQLTSAAKQMVSLNHVPARGDVPSTFFVGYKDTGQWIVAAYDPDYGDDMLPVLPATVQAATAKAGKPYNVASVDGTRRWRVLIEPRANGSVVVVAEDLSNADSAVSRLVFSELLVGAGVLVLLALVGAALVRASLKPLREIEQTAAAITEGDLTQRVPDFEPPGEEPRTEVGRVGRALNSMLMHVESAFMARTASEGRAVRSEERMRQFVADASHELRTPLTTIRGFAELYRQGAARDPEQAQRLISRIEGEAARMGLLVEDLLLLARLDQQRPLALAPTDLQVIANDAVTAARVVAPDRRITLEIVEGTGPLLVLGDESRLRQVVSNLMTNAVTHTPAGSGVWLRLRREAGQGVIEVVDEGPGLAAEQVDRVFERFYRVDAARTRRGGAGAGATSGTGLGLAIVAALVKAHGGAVEVVSEPGSGATFRVRLPLAQVPAPEPVTTGD
jgi:two-component system OmpR family sensor kinase